MGLSLRAAAKQLGMTHPGLKKAFEKGRVPRESDGTFDVEKCKAALAANTNLKKQRAAAAQKKGPAAASGQISPAESADGSVSYSEACRLHELLKIRERELALKVKEGLMIPVADAEREMGSLVSAARNKFLLVGAKCAPLVAVNLDIRMCQVIIDREIREVLSSLSDQEQELNAA